jgi:hypothetical protein
MTLAYSALASVTSGTAVGSAAQTTSSFTPPNNSLLVIGVGFQDTGTPNDFTNITITDNLGTHLTYTKVPSATSGTSVCATGWWTAPVTTGVAMTISVADATGPSPNMVMFGVIACTGYDTTTPIGVVASNNTLGGGTSAGTITLGSAPASTSFVIGGRVIDMASGVTPSATPGTNHTELFDMGTSGNVGFQIQVQDIGTASTSFTWLHVNDVSNSGGTANGSAFEIRTAAPTAPSAPAAPAAEVSHLGSHLTWVAPFDGLSPITGYFIEQNVASGGWTTVTSNTGNTLTEYSVTGLTTSSSVIFRVSAINAVGTSTASSSSSSTTPVDLTGSLLLEDGTSKLLLEDGTSKLLQEPGAGTGVNTTVAWTEDDDSWSVAAAETITATAAWTEDDDVWAVAAAVAATNTTIAWSEDDDVWAAVAAETITTTASWTEADDTWAVTAAESITAAVAYTEDDDQWSAAIAELIGSSVAWTEDDDSWSLAAAETITTAVAWSEDDDSWAVAAAESNTAAVAYTEDDDQWSVAIVESIPAAAAWTDDDDAWAVAVTQVAAGQIAVAWTEDDDQWLASLSESIGSTTAYTEDDDQWSVAIVATIPATASWSEDDDQWSVAISETITATAAWTEDDDTWLAAVSAGNTLTVAWTEDDDTWAVRLVDSSVIPKTPGATPVYISTHAAVLIDDHGATRITTHAAAAIDWDNNIRIATRSTP